MTDKNMKQKTPKRDENNNVVIEDENSVKQQRVRYSRRDLYTVRETVERNAHRIYIVNYPLVNNVTDKIIKSNKFTFFLLFTEFTVSSYSHFYKYTNQT